MWIYPPASLSSIRTHQRHSNLTRVHIYASSTDGEGSYNPDPLQTRNSTTRFNDVWCCRVNARRGAEHDSWQHRVRKPGTLTMGVAMDTLIGDRPFPEDAVFRECIQTGARRIPISGLFGIGDNEMREESGRGEGLLTIACCVEWE